MFKLAISNIAWESEDNKKIYPLMKKLGYCGLEIAPTKIIRSNPYFHLDEAMMWKQKLYEDFGIEIPSMQSIWYGRAEKIFGSDEERNLLLDYTKKAIDFAEAIGCENLVFGCPRNRSVPDGGGMDIAIRFFNQLGEYADVHHTVIAIEPNPPIYNTNFLNDIKEAVGFIETVDCKGIRLNLDTGAMIVNRETTDFLKNKGQLINHIHISEPGLGMIKERKLHRKLCEFLLYIGYDKYISIEMKEGLGINAISDCMKYVRGIFQ